MSENPSSPSARRHDVDWLRIFACYLLFIFHRAMVFNPALFYHPLLAGSVVLALAVYEGVVRRVGTLRVLHGMKRRSRSYPAVVSSRPQVASVLIAIAWIATGGSGAADAATVEGRWWAEDGAAQVEIARCGDDDELCGRSCGCDPPSTYTDASFSTSATRTRRCGLDRSWVSRSCAG